VARAAFDMEFTNEVSPTVPRYDIRTKYASLLGGAESYTQNRDEELAGIAAFVASERRMRS
jgi:hypothetical protein